jgi:hypothetical protein
LPRVFSGTKVEMKISIDGKPFPASQSICDTFNFGYGSTVGFKGNVESPDVPGFTNYIFTDNEMYKRVADHKEIIRILSALKFSPKTIDNFQAHFVREEFIRFVSDGIFTVKKASLFAFSTMGPETVIYEPEGTLGVKIVFANRRAKHLKVFTGVPFVRSS